jgi:hypothetical protein
LKKPSARLFSFFRAERPFAAFTRFKVIRIGGRWYDFLIQMVVIFVSITLSFAFNTWQEKRKNRETEVFYLRQVQEDVRDDIQELEEDIESYRFFRKGFAFYRRYHFKANPHPDSLRYFFNIFFRETYPNINNLGFEALRNTGKLDIISNPLIVRQLLKIHQESMPNLMNSIQSFLQIRRSQIYPYLVESLDFEDPHSVRKLLGTSHFRNLLNFYFGEILGRYQVALEDHIKLQQLIEEELRKEP